MCCQEGCCGCMPAACPTVKKAYCIYHLNTTGDRRLEENMEAGNNRNMEQFAEDIRERMEQQGRFEKVVIQDVMKNNGVSRCGLLMCSRGSNLVPTVYLEPFFKAYEDGADMDGITGKILESYESVLCEGVDMSFFQKFSMVKSRLCMALVNREMNQGLLAEIPYREFLDLAIIYYVDYRDPVIGAGTIRVHNSHMEMWGVTEEDLWEAASINTPERKPGRIEKMEDILAELLGGYGSDGSGCSCGNMEKGQVPMLVITNTERMYGAAVILYSGMLKQVADNIGSDLYILPSSRHEVIAIPVIGGREAAELKEMVMDVNRKELQTEDMLSDNVYVYWREQDRTEIA